jgi:hypothetical protein
MSANDPVPAAPDHARRTALRQLAALCGLAGLGLDEAFAAPKRPAKNAPPELLTLAELKLTGVLADLIIPRTDTPGALDAGVQRTVDHMLAHCAPAPAQAAFRAGLARIDAVARTQDGKDFGQLSAARQTALLHALDAGSAPFTAGDQGAFRQLKGYVAFAYYTSEPGATRELAYLPVPGGFVGDVKVTSATRTWAL